MFLRSRPVDRAELGLADPSLSRAAYLARAHFPALDGLRTLSILPVIWHHSSSHPLAGFLGKGPLGVHLFFAISGFLITTLLLRERRATGAISLSGFYARRSLRIFPLYYAVLGIYALRVWLFLPLSPMREHFLRNLPYFATYTGNFMVDYDVPHPVIFAFSWSLATEEQFYAVWPAILRFARGSYWLPIAAALGFFAIDFGAENGLLSSIIGPRSLGHAIITSISAPICLGALLALALDTEPGFRWLDRLLGRPMSAPVALAVLGFLIAADAPLVSIHLAMAALVGAVSIRADHGLTSLLEARPVRAIGTISYGMYLLHVTAIVAVNRILPENLQSSFAVFALATLATLGVAAISYRWFERPFLRLRARFRHSAGS